MSKQYYHPDTDFWRKYKIEAPEAISHGIEDTAANPLSDQIPKNKIISYTLEGNKLIAQTDLGEVVNYIPTEYILHGVDDKGQPILRRFDA